MEHRHQAEELYKHIRCNSPEEGNQLTTVKEYLKLFICKCLPDQKFQIKEVPHVIMSSVKEEWFISIKASEAFERLEYYFSLVSCNPWKAEFHSIRVIYLVIINITYNCSRQYKQKLGMYIRPQHCETKILLQSENILNCHGSFNHIDRE